MNAPASCAILGLGYLYRPLAETLWQHGSRVAAWKKHLTSDDTALPLALTCGDLADALHNGLQAAFAHWQDIRTWICLLPPSAFKHAPDTYLAAVSAWADAAAAYGANHLIFASSISVFGQSTGVCDEHTSPDPRSPNARLLLTAEAAVSAAAVPHTDILRLGGLYCAERHPLFSILAKKSRPYAAEPANMLHRSRAVSALFQTACTPDGHRLRHLVETPHPSKQQFYTAQAALLGLSVPAFAAGGNRRTVKTLYPEFSDILTVYQ
ncbi:GDP-L-fucose synthase [Kingella potus]|uniref:GDP-L-fucose synthase n=1 Tax=Kingella potus TaxID=265175 RepID=UPI001FD1ED54|nr:GDP-L-fucose synthase [Kingella potus]UOP01545.1 GDP-L-fucose synthase [Kingella potus]